MMIMVMQCHGMGKFYRFCNNVRPVRFWAATSIIMLGVLRYEQNRIQNSPLDPLDKEMVLRFYKKNNFPKAEITSLQQLKREAFAQESHLYDIVPYSSLRVTGPIDPFVEQCNGSRNTQCKFQYDCDQRTGEAKIARYDCQTCLPWGAIRKCLIEGIQEGRIK